MILELHRQGLSVSAIARRLGTDRKTVRKVHRQGSRAARSTARASREHARSIRSLSYLRARITAYPDLTGKRL